LSELAALLAASLPAWRIEGAVRDAGDAIDIDAGGTRLRVTRAPAELPFRWLIEIGERQRGATGIAGVLRVVRQALDPGYCASRLQIAARPVLP
jgi:hypothetical protein